MRLPVIFNISARYRSTGEPYRLPATWLLVIGVGDIRRCELGRALALSRAGADLQARALCDAELVTLGHGGAVRWSDRSKHKRLEATGLAHQGQLGEAITELDSSMAAIDALLARGQSDS